MIDSQELSQRVEIVDALLSYTRGIDRLDKESVISAFHPGAILNNYGPEPMPIEDFVEYALPSLKQRYSATQHRVSNIRIEIKEDRALVESYVLAYHVKSSESSKQLHTFNGRYIDTFALRDAHWKISERFLRNDWSKVDDITEEMAGSSVWVKSRRDADDPIYDI
ncbi:MAG: nuclear transport factor 2 family protein [Acidimicrobiales bacterium]